MFGDSCLCEAGSKSDEQNIQLGDSDRRHSGTAINCAAEDGFAERLRRPMAQRFLPGPH